MSNGSRKTRTRRVRRRQTKFLSGRMPVKRRTGIAICYVVFLISPRYHYTGALSKRVLSTTGSWMKNSCFLSGKQRGKDNENKPVACHLTHRWMYYRVSRIDFSEQNYPKCRKSRVRHDQIFDWYGWRQSFDVGPVFVIPALRLA